MGAICTWQQGTSIDGLNGSKDGKAFAATPYDELREETMPGYFGSSLDARPAEPYMAGGGSQLLLFSVFATGALRF